jgi:hypothetical protein
VNIVQWIIGLIFTLPPDFRKDALKEIEDGPQREFYESLDPAKRRGYLKDMAAQLQIGWLCKSMLIANIVTRVTFFAVVVLYARAGLLGPIFKWGSSALQASMTVIHGALAGLG